MDWICNNSSTVNPEEYLLGKPIDKGHFKEPSSQNFMRSQKDESLSSFSQVELSRRTKEDPLTIIREKELKENGLSWNRSLIKKSVGEPPVSVATDDEGRNSRSSIQLIIYYLKELELRVPIKIDLEEFYKRLKERKSKKLFEKYRRK